MTMRPTIALTAALLLGACATKSLPPAGDPLRPDAKPLPAVVAVEETVSVARPLAQAPEDCEPVAPNAGPPPKSYKERNIDEGAAHAKQGLQILFESEDDTRPSDEIARKLEEAIERFFTALAADPYNPRATYNLAAAYARIGRNQCSLNLLARLVAMRNWPSNKVAVAGHLDRLFGRGKRWKGKPDRDFDQLRRHPGFRDTLKDVM
jgi:tetratricopeptide (TPR) repeat protein